MGLGMLGHVILPNKSLSTLVADKRFFPGVEAQVPSEVRFVIKLLRAQFAFVRFVGPMLSYMVGEGRLLGESFATGLAFKGLPS